MAEQKFRGLIIGLVIFVVFAWLILSVAIDFGAEYDREADDIGDGSLDIDVFYDTADSVESDASNYRSRFESGDVDDVDDASGLFSIITDIVNMITAPFKLISQILNNIFGAPPIVTNVILGLLSIILILTMWAVLRKGD